MRVRGWPQDERRVGDRIKLEVLRDGGGGGGGRADVQACAGGMDSRVPARPAAHFALCLPTQARPLG
jgi:hypothetical protein